MNFSDDEDKNNRYDQGLNSSSSRNKTLKPIKEEQANETIAESSKISKDRHENVAAKVKGVTISQSPVDDTCNGNSNRVSTTEYNIIEPDTFSQDPVEDLIREWDANNKDIKSRQNYRKIAKHAAIIHLTKGRGITVSDLVDKGFGIDYAQKLLSQAASVGLFERLDNRHGKQLQYALSNCLHLLSLPTTQQKQEILPNDVSLLLARELSEMKYVYHNIHLVTNLNYNYDYHILNWDIQSKKNKQKIKSFTLEPRRSVNFRVSPGGTVNISIECTYHPFKFHTAEGLMSFFGICGQILTYLQLSTKNRFNVVSWFGDWYLQQFDYNKDLQTKYLKNKYSSNGISWSSKGVLKVYYLGAIFQAYCKMMPYKGECHRFEGRHSTKEKVKMTDIISDIAAISDTGNNNNNKQRKHPFTTIEEMLLNKRRGNQAGVVGGGDTSSSEDRIEIE